MRIRGCHQLEGKLQHKEASATAAGVMGPRVARPKNIKDMRQHHALAGLVTITRLPAGGEHHHAQHGKCRDAIALLSLRPLRRSTQEEHPTGRQDAQGIRDVNAPLDPPTCKRFSLNGRFSGTRSGKANRDKGPKIWTLTKESGSIGSGCRYQRHRAWRRPFIIFPLLLFTSLRSFSVLCFVRVRHCRRG
jgi:hypothetical protein